MENVRCDLCGSNQPLPDRTATWSIALQPPYRVVRCRACRLAFMNPRMTAAEYRAFYAGEQYLSEFGYGELLQTSRIREFNRTLDRLERFRTPPGRLLDVGTATGEFLVEAKKRGWEVAGTEISDSSVAVAKERYDLNVFHGPLDAAPLAGQSFDVIHLSHVLEHVSSPQATLANAKRLLKIGGILVVEVPHEFDNWFVRIGRLLGRFQPATSPSMHHVYFFTPHTLRATLQKGGFAPMVSTYSMDIPYRSLPSPLRRLGNMVTVIIDRLGGGIYLQAFATSLETKMQ